MRRVEPKVFLVAATELHSPGIYDYLNHVGGHPGAGGVFDPAAARWLREGGGASDGELLVEFMGRLCYRSWKPGLNANVTRVREGNGVYLKNILDVKHGSVLEHANFSFVFADVSRVFTHELVRHRAGVAISQESLRFVRLDDLGMWAPTCIREAVIDCLDCAGSGEVNDGTGTEECPSCDGSGEMLAVDAFEQVFSGAEQLQKSLAKSFGLDDPGTPFSKKKEITSALRRVAPDGLATTIGWTANARALRHVLAMRTHESAEEEIRLVFDEVGKIAHERWPNLFQDFVREEVKGIGQWTSPGAKA